MHAFTRFLEESKRINHFYQFDRGFWTWRFVCGLEFRINQLEFEMVTPPHKYSPGLGSLSAFADQPRAACLPMISVFPAGVNHFDAIFRQIPQKAG